MTKSELIERIVTHQGQLSSKDVELAIKTMLEQMSQALSTGDRIEIRGFGSFSLHYRAPRVGRNPKTGDSVRLDGKFVPHFKPGKALREQNRHRGLHAHVLSVAALAELAPAIRFRVIRLAGTTLGGHFHRSHVLEIDHLVTNWHGQKPLAVPGVRVERQGENLVLKSTKTLKPGAC